MMLTTTQFLEIIGFEGRALATGRALQLPAGATVRTDRRSTTRVPLGRRAQLRFAGPHGVTPWLAVMIRDVSEGGVSLMIDRPVGLNKTVQVRFDTASGGGLVIEVQVRRCEPGGSFQSGYVLGGEFVAIVDQRQFHLQDAYTAEPQRRRWLPITDTSAALLQAVRMLVGRVTRV